MSDLKPGQPWCDNADELVTLVVGLTDQDNPRHGWTIFHRGRFFEYIPEGLVTDSAHLLEDA